MHIPYYNTNNNFQTAFSVRNTTSDYKALKVRLRESGNSNDVLDFNVYMSPQDVFTFTVTADGVNSPRLSTDDKTCTFPAIPAGGVPLKGDVYKATSVVDAREGYVEIIEMGVIDSTVTLTTATTNVSAGGTVVSGLLHDSTGTPKDCGVIAQALADGVWTRGGSVSSVAPTTIAYHATNASPAGFFTPTGGLSGSSILLDLANGAAFVADPIALVNYAANHTTAVSGSTAAGVNVTYPGTTAASSGNGAQYYLPNDKDYFLLPSLASGNVNTSEVAADNGMATLVTTWSTVKSDWGLADPNAVFVNDDNGPASGVNTFPVAHALAATSVINQYFIDPTFDGATDWVVTFPMRKHGIYNGYHYDGGTSAFYTYKGVGVTGTTGGVTLAVDDDVTFTQTDAFYDREEQAPIAGTDFSPVVSGGNVQLEREVNILSFTNSDNATNKVLGSTFADSFTLESGFVAGWAQLALI
jgi:hypothetical protein